MTRVALTIAGSDSGGGAGIVADLKTFEAHGVWGTCAVVAVTAQDTVGVRAFEAVSPALVRQQIEAVGRDIGVHAAKTGMLATAEHVEAARDGLAAIGNPPVVVDPVLVSKHGDALLDERAVATMRDVLLPVAAVVTPNIPEAEALTGMRIRGRDDMAVAAEALSGTGAAVVLLKGGHLEGDRSPDLVWCDGTATWLDAERIPGRHTHGTGCVLSAAIAAELARGMDPVDACVAAKRFVERAIAAGLPLGTGIGPVNPGWERAL